MFGAAGVADYVLFQHGAPAHAARAVQVAFAELSPSCFEKKGRPSNSPDLNVLDFLICGVRATENELAGIANPAGPGAGDRSIHQRRPGCDGPKRCGFRAARREGTFNRALKSKAARDIEPPPRRMPSGEPGSPGVPGEPINDLECELMGDRNELALESGTGADA